MTTYTFSGISLNALRAGGVSQFNGYFDYSLTVPDGGQSFQYTYDGFVGDTGVIFQGTVLPNDETWTAFGDETLPNMRFEEITWGDGNITQIMVIGDSDSPLRQDMFFLSGDDLPEFRKTADLKAFFDSITLIDTIKSGPFAPNSYIDLADIPGATSTESDRIEELYSSSQGPKTYDGGLGNDTIIGYSNNDTLIGGSGADVLSGGGGRDNINGGAEDDRLKGDSSNDTLIGGSGNDRLDGGSGKDTMQGGTGTDTVIGGSSADLIIFNAGDGADSIVNWKDNSDTLQLDDALWSEFGILTVQQVLDEFSDTAVVDGRQSVVLDFGNEDRLVFEGFGSAVALLDDITIV